MSKYARPAPAIFPLPYHRSMADVMREEWRIAVGEKTAQNRRDALLVQDLFRIKGTGQNSVCTAELALTSNRLA